ncbi:MAG: hypothetical protein IJZ82_08175 [Lachnospiraceae bacterium]|nr:hypothetical protein [Lachnospiraceae bacterium]
MNFIALFLVIMLYPFILLMYFLLKNDATPKKNIYFGVTIDKEHKKDPDVEQIVEKYNKRMKHYLWVLLLTPIPLMFIPWFSIFLTGWMLWLLATCFAFFIPFGIANKELKELKVTKGWNHPQQLPVYVEMKSAGNVRRVKWYHFLPQNVLNVVIVFWTLSVYAQPANTAMRLLVYSFATIAPLFWFVAVWMDKQKTQIISMNSDVNVNYNRAKKNLWKDFWVICSWVSVLYMLSIPFALTKSGQLTGIFWAASILYTLVTLALLFWMIKKKNHIDSTYSESMHEAFTDDDSHWLWGMIYYNPKNKHSMVEKRVGIGTTVNLATPVGKGFTIFAVLSLLSIPAICIWVILLEFTPIALTVSGDRLVATHLREEYSISLDGIQNAELLTELPRMSKNHGTSMDTLKKGSFMVSEGERCTVFLNPESALFIRFEAFGETYYFSGNDAEETRFVYEAIQ